MLGVKFRRFACVVCGVLRVALSGVRVVGRCFMIACFVMLTGFPVVARCVLVMICCLSMVVRCFLGHVVLP
jgi:hypothetical protein